MGFLDKLFGRKNVSNPVKPAEEPKSEPKNVSAIEKKTEIKEQPPASPAPAPKVEAQKPVAAKPVEPEKPKPVKQENPEKAKEKETIASKTTVTSETNAPHGHDVEKAREETKKEMDELLRKMYGSDSGGLKKSQESIRFKAGQQEANK